MLPPEIQLFIDKFSRLPSIGPRMATRLAFYISSLSIDERKELIKSIEELNRLDRCQNCFCSKTKTDKLCSFCTDTKRDYRQIAIVEKDTDVFTIEKTGSFRGVYFVIGELDHRNPLGEMQKNRLKNLKMRVASDKNGEEYEIIIALAPNTFGDFVSELIKQGFKETKARITHIGRGIQTGGEIEFADEETLKNAFDSRR